MARGTSSAPNDTSIHATAIRPVRFLQARVDKPLSSPLATEIRRVAGAISVILDHLRHVISCFTRHWHPRAGIRLTSGPVTPDAIRYSEDGTMLWEVRQQLAIRGLKQLDYKLM